MLTLTSFNVDLYYYRATGTLRNQLLFKDTTVLQMCEEGGNHGNLKVFFVIKLKRSL